MQFSPIPVTSSLSQPNILLISLFSKTINLYSFLHLRDQVPDPYKRASKIEVMLYVFKYETEINRI
jgi:hypothetical protein